MTGSQHELVGQVGATQLAFMGMGFPVARVIIWTGVQLSSSENTTKIDM
jgi:hypothetical protein